VTRADAEVQARASRRNPMEIGNTNRIYTIEPVKDPIPAGPDKLEETVETERPQGPAKRPAVGS